MLLSGATASFLRELYLSQASFAETVEADMLCALRPSPPPQPSASTLAPAPTQTLTVEADMLCALRPNPPPQPSPQP